MGRKKRYKHPKALRDWWAAQKRKQRAKKASKSGSKRKKG